MFNLQIPPIFKIGDFEVTLPMIIYAAFILVMIIAIIAYRSNHRIQTGVSRYMDNESGIFNQKGLEKMIIKKGKRFSNPTTMLVEIRNLSYLYSNYPYQSKLIYKITDVLLSGLKKKEFAGRIEFNKYILVLEDRSKDNIKELCLKIQDELDKLEFEEHGKFDFYVYFGIYESAPLRDENVILYTSEIINYSKISIANLYYFSIEVKEAIERIKRMNLEKDYDYEQHRFVPYVQPKVDLTTGKVVGGEILVRWVDDSQNYKYPPSEFIPLFEKNGFVAKIDEEMFRQACLLAGVIVNKGHPDIKISVNISKLKFLSPNFEQSIINIVNETHVNPKNIEIEVTETTVMENFQYVSNCIMKLRQFGFNVSMDDFGQEYSSLGALSMNPFDIIKLDRVFFKNKLSTEKDRLIVRNILEMLNDLNYIIVCEGVSDKQTLDMLATINQNVIIQGYVISQPIPVSQFEAFVDTVFEFNYPPVENRFLSTTSQEQPQALVDVEKTNGANGSTSTSINISGLGGNNNDQIDEMKRQMMEMERKFQQQLETQRRETQEAEMRRMREEMMKLKELSNKPNNYGSDELDSLRREISSLRNESRKDSNPEIEALRREIEALRYQNLYYTKNNNVQPDYHRDDEMYRLKREVYEMKYQQERDRERERYDRDYYYEKNNINNDELGEIKKQIREIKDNQNNPAVNDLINRVSSLENDTRKSQENDQTSSLKSQLEKERKEREDLEKLLYAMLEENKSKPNDNYQFDLDLDKLSDDEFEENDDFDDEFEEDAEEAVTTAPGIRKPSLTLDEVKAIIAHYRGKYGDNWQEQAKVEMKEGYYNLINDILYYQNLEKRTLPYKIKHASGNIKQVYNIVKNKLMSYNNVSNKMVNGYDSFYIGRKQIAKMHLTSSKLKVFLAVNPNDYPERLFPHKDFSHKKVHSRTPYYTLLKSQLSVKRINKVIEDMFSNDNVVENQHYTPVDYAKNQSDAFKSFLD